MSISEHGERFSSDFLWWQSKRFKKRGPLILTKLLTAQINIYDIGMKNTDFQDLRNYDIIREISYPKIAG